jgi:hypothetical protein
MELRKQALALNTTCIVIATTILATILHELAHYLMAFYFNLQPILHHNYVSCFEEGSAQQKAIVAVSGPLFSLVFGIAITLLAIIKIKPSLTKLFFTWLGTGSLLHFLGYVLIAPMIKKGDTGKVYAYLEVPIYLQVIMSIVAFIIINRLFRKISNQFIYYKSSPHFDWNENKKQLFIYPILSSMVILTLLNFPISSWISLLPPLFLPLTYFKTMKYYTKLKMTAEPILIDKLSRYLILMTLVMVGLYRYLAY